STATHSLCSEHVWRMALWISRSDGTCCEPGGPTRGVERRAAWGSLGASDDDGVWRGARERRGETNGDTPLAREPACAREAPPSVGGPRVAARPLLTSAVQGEDRRGSNCIIAARRLT